MGILDLFRSAPAPQASALTVDAPYLEQGAYLSLDDPRLADLLRGGKLSDAGVLVTVEAAMRIPAVLRCVSLISNTIGMLPLHLKEKGSKENAEAHPLYSVLHRRPNTYQTAMDFRSNMQLRAMTKGNAYARIIRSTQARGGSKVTDLVPMDPDRVDLIQNADWTMSYRYTPPSGAKVTYRSEDVLHLRGLSLDGICGISQVYAAADAIGLAKAANQALGRLYRNGSFVNGYIKHPKTLGERALEKLRATWDGRFSGSENAGRTPIFEEGMEYVAIGPNAKDAQSHETRSYQVEEIARVFGVPRPLLMIDETSWGSGIDALGQFFVQYGLSPWFEAWQQAIERSLLTEAETARYEVKFNAGGLLRGSMQAQGEYFSKALGAGGHSPWMTANEVRRTLDMPDHTDGDRLVNPMTNNGGAAPAGSGEQGNG